MATIAKGMITLSSVNDAFSVSLNPNSCVINADWDGSNPRLDNAYTDIRVYRGDVAVEFSQPVILGYSHNNVTASVTKIDNQTWRIKFATIDTSSLNGKVNLKIVVGSEFATTVSFGYTVVRETSMLDWILDWEGREKTEISGEHIITPKIFVGKSENGGQLTGTYIGPAFDGSGRTGVFGYSAGVEIFHLDNTGGAIGGWRIEDGGIQTSDGTLKILSEGTIVSAPDGVMSWQLNKNGTATFAGGDVKLAKNLSVFKGEIHAAKGKIGNWSIGNSSLYNSAILINSSDRYIGVRNIPEESTGEPSKAEFINSIKAYGGVSIFYENSNSFGIEGWAPSSATIAEKVFSLGSSNSIAGWRFDKDALWSGEDISSGDSGDLVYAKVNTVGRFTLIKNALTIGSRGIRGNCWRLESDGSGALANGQIWWDDSGYCEFKGTLNAASIIGSSITGGTIQAVDYIKSENGSWQFNKDGSGKLANGNIDWKADGRVKVSGGLRADTLELAICKTMDNGYIDGSSGSFISPNTGPVATLILPALSLNCARIFHLMVPSDNQTFRIGFEDANVSYSIPGEERSVTTVGEKFDEDGFASIVGLAGDWLELVGIKTLKSTLESMMPTDLTSVTANHMWLNGEMVPLTGHTRGTEISESTSEEAYHTHWFLLPKSSRLHWFMMDLMGLTL